MLIKYVVNWMRVACDFINVNCGLVNSFTGFLTDLHDCCLTLLDTCFLNSLPPSIFWDFIYFNLFNCISLFARKFCINATCLSQPHDGIPGFLFGHSFMSPRETAFGVGESGGMRVLDNQLHHVILKYGQRTCNEARIAKKAVQLLQKLIYF